MQPQHVGRWCPYCPRCLYSGGLFGRCTPRRGGWRLSSSAARKGGGLVIRQTKGQTLHTGQKNSAGAASSSPHGGRVCVRLSTLSIFGAVCFSCSCGIASTRRPSVSILSTLSIFGRAVWTLHPRRSLRLLGRSLFVGRGRLFSYRIASMRGAAISGGVWTLHPLGVLC